MYLSQIIPMLRGQVIYRLLQIGAAVLPSVGMGVAYRAMLVKLVRASGLFDEVYYLDHNQDVAASAQKPVRHYVLHGDREGRFPLPLFEPEYYRQRAGGLPRRANALLHYLCIGRFQGIPVSPWFDTGYYLKQNKDIARSGMDPLEHFLAYGGTEGRSPSPHFDSQHYLGAYPEVADYGLNPLVHFLLRGRQEGKVPLPSGLTAGAAWEGPEQRAADVDWQGLVPRAGVRDTRAIDVVVPVYRGYVETLHCLYSVLAAPVQSAFELIVIDDASPDERLSEKLLELADLGLFTLLRNERNRGFVESVNLGMAQHDARDVVLLNSDAEVYGDWLDRFRDVALKHDDAATITPLSNNATICSYPHNLRDNPFPLELAYSELDQLAARVNAGETVEAPTGVGFCMYIRRDCLTAIGTFDAGLFGRGYGEENDFCQRAIEAGWRNLIAADIFVRHLGAMSFRGEQTLRVQDAMKKMADLHPSYNRQVRSHIRKNPLAAARRRLDWARLERLRRESNVLIVAHQRGGGTERHIGEDVHRLSRNGYGVFTLRPVPGKKGFASIGAPGVFALPSLPPVEISDSQALAKMTRSLGISEVHTHGLVDFDARSPDHIRRLIEITGVRFEANVHDYKVICPRINLADQHGRYCGEPDDRGCNRCLKTRGSNFHVTDVGVWRERHWAALRRADAVLVPDEDVRQRLLRYFPDLAITVSPHDEEAPPAYSRAIPPKDGARPRRIVVVGALSRLKGYDVLLACARYVKKSRLPIEFVLMGYGVDDQQLKKAGVSVTGKYNDDDAVSLLTELEPDMVWLPAIWPETYSYTLSIALQLDVPIAAFDLGAIASRLRRIGHTDYLMSLKLMGEANRIAQLFQRWFAEAGPGKRVSDSLSDSTRDARK